MKVPKGSSSKERGRKRWLEARQRVFWCGSAPNAETSEAGSQRIERAGADSRRDTRSGRPGSLDPARVTGRPEVLVRLEKGRRERVSFGQSGGQTNFLALKRSRQIRRREAKRQSSSKIVSPRLRRACTAGKQTAQVGHLEPFSFFAWSWFSPIRTLR